MRIIYRVATGIYLDCFDDSEQKIENMKRITGTHVCTLVVVGIVIEIVFFFKAK